MLGALVGRMMVKKTKRFLELEAQGLKARSEQLHPRQWFALLTGVGADNC